jgi:regulator of nucleoside diphosphate kinase
MQASNIGERKLAATDFTRLEMLAAAGGPPQLAGLLDEADVLPQRALPADVVTLHARIVTRDARTRRRQELVICWPQDADAAKGRISVLSPAGLGLLGLQRGAIARWHSPGGEECVVIEDIVASHVETEGRS